MNGECPPSEGRSLGSRPVGGEGDVAAWGRSLSLLAVAVVVCFVAIAHVRANLTWWLPLLRDLMRWLGAPHIAGGWRPPASPFLALAILALSAALGLLAARRLLRGSDLAGDRPLLAGLAIASSIALLGWVAMAAVVARNLSRSVLLPALLAAGAVLLVTNLRDRDAGSKAGGLESNPALRGGLVLRRAVFVLSALVLLATFVHSAMSPVLEWDATAYHAETARRWFQDRPSPPLEFGPSIGYQISGNYPPLFPASGAAIYVLLGRFDDVYLRVLSPLLFAAVLLIVFGYARRRLGEAAACFSVLLILGTPLMVMYAAWPTSYMLLAVMMLATVVLADVAARGKGSLSWAMAGVAAGLALLSHVYGVAALAAPIAAALFIRGQSGSRRAARGAAVAVAVAVAVASPWLLRNLLLLGDPLYPLASPPFAGKGLVQPFWGASRDLIRAAALNYWDMGEQSVPRVTQAATALFDRHLLPTGLYFGILLGAYGWRRARTLTYLSSVLVALLATLILPGWFWLRAIVPALPIAAIATGAGLARLSAETGGLCLAERAGFRWLVRGAAPVIIAVILGPGACMGAALAVAGPNQDTWTTNLGPRDNLLQSTENLGSSDLQLWTTFSGDVAFWGWIDRHLSGGDGVATLEIRTYYLRDPGGLFYLDGKEAEPLLSITSPSAAARYLLVQGVRYIAIPSWSVDASTGSPHADLLPLYEHLGSARFPAIAAFPVGESGWPSVVYAVGEAQTPLTVGVFPGRASPPGSRVVRFTSGESGARLVVPRGTGGRATLRLSYRLTPSGGATLFVADRVLTSLSGPEGGEDSRWRTVSVRLPRAPTPFVEVLIRVVGGNLQVRDIVAVALG